MRHTFLPAILIFLTAILHAQPDKEYVSNLTKDIDLRWLSTVSELPLAEPLNWDFMQAPGFLKVDKQARKQALLAEHWSFFAVDTFGNIAEGVPVRFPHKFDKERNYKSGWYVINCEIDTKKEDRHFLKLNRVQMFCQVYVNGLLCNQHFGAFTPFETDISHALTPGKNCIALFVYDQSSTVDGDKVYNQIAYTRLRSVYRPEVSSAPLAGGITDVPRMEVRTRTHLKDLFISTSTRKSEMNIEYELPPDAGLSRKAKLSFELFHWPDGEKVDLDIPSVSPGQLPEKIGNLKVPWQDPQMWSPEYPKLYVLRATLKDGKNTDVLDTRFGFREFWVDGKTFMLNGTPIRLRGESYYYPVLNGRDFHREHFLLHKELFGSNACRLHAFMPPGDVVLGADEAGVLLIDQSAIWSENASYYRNGGEWFLKNVEREFEEWARRDRNSPSVVIWDVENEMLRISYDLHLPWVDQLPGFIQKFDTTRPFNNSAQGWVRPVQDMALLHMQEHYSRIMNDWTDKGTYPLIMGEFWIGGRAEQRLTNSPEIKRAIERYEEEAGIYEEQMLEMRYLGVTGVMPFRISACSFPGNRNPSAYHFTPPDKLEVELRSGKVIQKIRHGLQPVSVFFWPRQNYAAAGKKFERELVLCNDGETEQEFEISWKWENGSENIEKIKLSPADQHILRIRMESPAEATKLYASVSSAHKQLSADTMEISPIELPEINPGARVQVYKDQKLAKMLNEAGIPSIFKNRVPEAEDGLVWIIPEEANTRELNLIKEEILNYLKQGGFILCLKQDQAPVWFPVKLNFWSANQTSPHLYAMMGWEGLNKDLFFSTEAPIYAPSHPVFSGLNTPTLRVWNEFDGRVSDDVFARPSKIGVYEPGNWRVLAGGTRREHASLTEIFYGKGILLSCQLHVLENFRNIQAQTLLLNMLNYLSNQKSSNLDGHMELRGGLTPEELSALTGASEASFEGASPDNQDVLMAFEGSSLSEIKEWASAGGRVFVFSEKISASFDGIEVESNENRLYYATKGEDHSLLYGVASTNYMDPEYPLIGAYFSNIPDHAEVLLHGFSNPRSRSQRNLGGLWQLNDAGPVLLALPYGKGEIILSTLSFAKDPGPAGRELLSLILTNARVEVPSILNKKEAISIRKTVPLVIDGQLNDWLEDMEDRLVSKYIHAQAIYLTSESIVEGPPEFDLNLSAIDYFMWNEQALYVAGAVFGEVKTFESGIQWGSEKEYEKQILFNEDVINISFRQGEAKVLVNGKDNPNLELRTGSIESKNMTDATRLQFNFIHKSGQIVNVDELTGETFELKIPWDLLKSKVSDGSQKALITLSSRGSKIQDPLSADPLSDEHWLEMHFEKTEQ